MLGVRRDIEYLYTIGSNGREWELQVIVGAFGKIVIEGFQKKIIVKSQSIRKDNK